MGRAKGSWLWRGPARPSARSDLLAAARLEFLLATLQGIPEFLGCTAGFLHHLLLMGQDQLGPLGTLGRGEFMNEAAFLFELGHLGLDALIDFAAHAGGIRHGGLHDFLHLRAQTIPDALVDDEGRRMMQVTRRDIVRRALCGRGGHVVREGQIGCIDQTTLQGREEFGQRHLHTVGPTEFQ